MNSSKQEKLSKRKRQKFKRKIAKPYTDHNKLPLGLIVPDLPPINEQFPPIETEHWDNVLKSWLMVWEHRRKITQENLENLKLKFGSYYQAGFHVDFINYTLASIFSDYKSGLNLRGTKPLIFEEDLPILDDYKEKAEAAFYEKAKRRSKAFLEIIKQCQEYNIGELPLLEIAFKLREKECINLQRELNTEIQRDASAHSYRELIKAPLGKKITNPLLCNQIRCLVDYFSQFKKYERFKKKGVLPEVSELLNLIGIPIKEKTIERYCTLVKPLSRLPFPTSA